MNGQVVFIGAGPGHARWITVAGQQAIAEADVILIDALVSLSLLSYIQWDATVIDVGKRAGKPSQSQKEICDLLVQLASKGKQVIRLKGGDPCTFGRLAEEIQVLLKAGISYEIIPGITAASAAAARAGISLTDRDISASLTLLTGHRRTAGPKPELDWEAASRSGTGAIYMGVLSAAENVQKLKRHGVSSETPVLIAQAVTTPKEKLVVSSLETLETDLKDKHIRPPAVWVYGGVVTATKTTQHKVRANVGFFRPDLQKIAWHSQLFAAGFEPCTIPLQRICDPPDAYKSFDASFQIASQTSGWLVFTSPTAVIRWWQRCQECRQDLRQWHRWKIAAVGKATARRLTNIGIMPDVTGSERCGTDQIPALLGEPVGTVLLCQASDARLAPHQTLADKGWQVHPVLTHAKEHRKYVPETLRIAIERRWFDYVVWTATSQIEVVNRWQLDQLWQDVHHIAFGTQTEAALNNIGATTISSVQKSSLQAVIDVLSSS
ncbi:porphyrin biosynthesis protein HemD-like [Ylistrum balloti]|uniref:porphyrin biosynthesis protein HemD-like n=1 Tax=Ylistrum balloti TaxID=509963 RepID=UPI002905CF0B|nr:porphyrin biosynthesis protein HemD-like [Ylistrum balloti]